MPAVWYTYFRFLQNLLDRKPYTTQSTMFIDLKCFAMSPLEQILRVFVKFLTKKSFRKRRRQLDLDRFSFQVEKLYDDQ